MSAARNGKLIVVGVGASAGGLEALERFFDAVPWDSGLCFIVIQHLSPDFKSLMDELLARHTKMTIIKVEKETPLEPNKVYLIPPRKQLSLEGDSIIPSDYPSSTSPRSPIDTLFKSLGELYGNHAIGVVLSGTGKDGTKGCEVIRNKGGLVVAQEPSTAKFDGMPVNVIQSGLAHFSLPPEGIWSALWNHAQNIRTKALNPERSDTTEKSKVAEDDIFAQILTKLRGVDGIDFSSYRSSTLARRLERRMRNYHIEDPATYLKLLNETPQELKDLHGELLIGVTKFFRDAETFEHIRTVVVPELCRSQNTPLRVWIAGCSTGEEAYTYAMILADHILRSGLELEFKIFATDVDRESLTIANRGMFSATQVEGIPPAFLQRYFTLVENEYIVNPPLRKSILFSHHNVTKDPPFTKLNLVSCRNLLIYFQTNLQLKVLTLFHFGLKAKGFLVLGRSEALGDIAEEFENENSLHKIFVKKRDVRLSFSDFAAGSPLSAFSGTADRGPLGFKRLSHQPLVNSDTRLLPIYEKLLGEYVAAGIIVDESLTLLHTFGKAHEWLQMSPGKITFEASRLLPKELAVALAAGVTLASKQSREVKYKNVSFTIKDEPKLAHLIVRPISLPGSPGPAVFLALFEDNLNPTPAAFEKEPSISFQLTTQVSERIQLLEEQLSISRETLQTTIEELETTNEELQSTNEELMSSNEELQSSNEELHSVNEELYTVNSEYQKKIDELTEANSDIDFLVKSSRVGIVFLGPELSIRRFTPGLGSVISLRAHDVGRPISELTFRFDHDKIMGLIEQSLRSGKSTSGQIRKRDKVFLVNVILHLSSEASPGMTVRQLAVAFVDISSQKKVSELMATNDNLERYQLKSALAALDRLRNLQRELVGAPVQGDGLTWSLQGLLDQTLNMANKWVEFAQLKMTLPTLEILEVTSLVRKAASEVDIPYGQLSLSNQNSFFGNRNSLLQMFRILLTLSRERFQLKASKEGQVTPAAELQIFVSARKDEGRIVFSYSDSGPSITTSDYAEPFLFLTESISTGQTELNCGLPFVARIIESHGGEWEVTEADREFGWSFGFSLPNEL
jgi:two-component system, chemotaxis family, CheB/CheR fusion protein